VIRITRDASGSECLECHVGDEFILMNLEQAWRDVFAYWDKLVPTELAERIATSTVSLLREAGAGS